MKPSLTSPADLPRKPADTGGASSNSGAGINVVIITLDNNLAGAVAEARTMLGADLPGVNLTVHAATDWHENETRLQACKDDIAKGDIIIATMLFIEDHVKAVVDDLAARRDHCDALVCCMSAGEVMKHTAMGKFRMDGEQKGPLALLKKLRGGKGKGKETGKTAGERQMRMLKRLPKMLKYIPGTAQDVRNYFLTLQYRLSASPENIANMVRLLVNKYADGDHAALRGKVQVADPVDYPETGLYHPDLSARVTDDFRKLPMLNGARGTVGLLLLRSYILSGDTGHYDGVIRAFNRAGFNVIPCFANGLDNRPAMDAYLDGSATGQPIDALVSLTGFSLVGGPAYSDAAAAGEALTNLDVPYVAAHVTEFQTLEAWESSDQGLMPIESTIMVAIPELDGAIASQVFGGRSEAGSRDCTCARKLDACPAGQRCMHPHNERVARLVGRVEKLVALRKAERAKRRLAITLFNFPPNAGNTGTAAFLSVFESLHATLHRLADEGYDVGKIPASVDDLRDAVLNGNAADHGTTSNVHHLIPVDDHVAREPYLNEIEAAWGPAPGRDLTNGSHLMVLGKRFGNVLVAVQPGFGYEGDPMRLLFEKGFAPTHAFSAFYRYLREDFAAHAVLHFGTHGALEFMPGKQVGMGEACWPDRLIGDLPNYYLYAANNPSEGTIAKRRSAATLVSYLTPPLTQAGLYKGLSELKASLARYRNTAPSETAELESTAQIIAAQAEQLDLHDGSPVADTDAFVAHLTTALVEMEHALIPDGLHVLGQPMDSTERRAMLGQIEASNESADLSAELLDSICESDESEQQEARASLSEDSQITLFDRLVKANKNLAENNELTALTKALDGRFIAPSPSGDLIRSPDLLPTGRNIHGFDPFRIPSQFATRDGARQAALVLERYLETDNALPETIAIVLWGTDNLKSEGAPMAQALALLGARPRLDSYGRVVGAELIPLGELKRPRIDVVITLSGIFRDLLPMQARMMAEACHLAAHADEPAEQNFVRKHALAYAEQNNCTLEEATYRVFSNAEGAYGANVNFLIGSSAWTDDEEIANQYSARKCFAIDHKGKTESRPEIFDNVMGRVDMAYQNLDSVELGVTTIDHYFDTLGGIAKTVERAKKTAGDDSALKVFISDQTQGAGKVRTLGEQVSLETRTRSLNPKWFEGMLSHGHEGVRQIEAQIANTVGWSATTGQVQPWVYEELTQTFVLDDAMRARLADLNPAAAARIVERVMEAHARDYWQADDETLDALQRASEDMEDRLEGITPPAAPVGAMAT
ncbi:MAG: magnesium chelatase subunit H [Pseudomonadota bacterium]